MLLSCQTSESLGGGKLIHFAYFLSCDDSHLEEKHVAEDGLRQLKPMKIETDDPLYSFHTVQSFVGLIPDWLLILNAKLSLEHHWLKHLTWVDVRHIHHISGNACPDIWMIQWLTVEDLIWWSCLVSPLETLLFWIRSLKDRWCHAAQIVNLIAMGCINKVDLTRD